MENISIIICTRNRAKYLDICLSSLFDQTVSDEFFEVIVVDNMSSDDTSFVCNTYSKKFRYFTYIVENKIGLSHARNKGMKLSKGKWIGYLDDDAKAYPNFVERAMFIINNYNFDAFGGRYLPWYPEGKPKWIPEEFGSNGFLTKDVAELQYPLYFSGGNCFYKKEVLEIVGGFNPEYGMVDNKLNYGEETLVQLSMRGKNMKLGFDPYLNIEHLVADYKQNVWWILRSNYKRNTHYYIATGTYGNWNDFRKIWRVLTIETLRKIKNNFPKLFKKEYYIQNFILDSFTITFRFAGRLRGFRFSK